MQNFQKQFAPVDEFLRKSGDFVPFNEGNYLGDTFSTVRVVLISAAISGNRNPLDLAAFTSLPVGFVDMIFRLMDRLDLWKSDNSMCLFRILKEAPEDLAEIEHLVDLVATDLWDGAPSQHINEYLGDLRQGILPGGNRGTYPLHGPDCDNSRLHSAYLGQASKSK